MEVELEVSRRAPGELTVRLALETSAPDVRLRVVYACDYAVDDDVPDAEVEAIVFGAAPGVLYPCLREEVTRLTANSRLGPYPLPFLPPPLQRLERFAMPGSVDDEDGGKDAA
ncbi:MAG TPA: hypothetical protein VFJ82_17430 [Longimicrobium sp.]|nr:hypothetical protein [Longimicrobium sp.]